MPGERGDGLLLFGVREQGRSHEDFEYVCRVVGAHYTVNEHGNLVLVDELREFYRFSPRQHPEVRFDCGLSSLEYDPHHGRLFLLTSFEVEEAGEPRIGGYLWVVSLAGFSAGQAPELVRTVQGDALEFEHKAEGLAVLDSERLFVAYDNDRDMSLGRIDERDERHACEAPYTMLHIT